MKEEAEKEGTNDQKIEGGNSAESLPSEAALNSGDPADVSLEENPWKRCSRERKRELNFKESYGVPQPQPQLKSLDSESEPKLRLWVKGSNSESSAFPSFCCKYEDIQLEH